MALEIEGSNPFAHPIFMQKTPLCVRTPISLEGTIVSRIFKDVVELRRGDSEGNRMVVKLTTDGGTVIHAVAVPQDWPSRTGPTWTYLFENEGLTLMDAGATGSYAALEEGIAQTGFKVGDIERVVITHGHVDHDGAAGELAQEADAEIWAHEIYSHLLPYNPWDIQREAFSPIQQEMRRVTEEYTQGDESAGFRPSEYRSRHEHYIVKRRSYEVKRNIQDGDSLGGLMFMHAPGHSPDEICAALDGVVFTGDHVLPEITPHPTTKARYSDVVKESLPKAFHDEDAFYGLNTYLNSLKNVVDLGPEVAVLPAHRLFNKGRYNFQTVSRASEIIRHHGRRLGRILHKVGRDGASLEVLTRGFFARRKLMGGNLYAAMSEVVAHIELLEDIGDIHVADDRGIHATGSENYKQLIHELTS